MYLRKYTLIQRFILLHVLLLRASALFIHIYWRTESFYHFFVMYFLYQVIFISGLDSEQ